MPCADSYRLNGIKTFVTNTPVCDLTILFASTAPTKGSWGLSTFVASAALEGLSIPASDEAHYEIGYGIKVTTELALPLCHRHDYVAYLDDDCKAPEQWLATAKTISFL